MAIEALPVGASASRHAIVRWSGGSIGEAVRWCDDEALFYEWDLLAKTRAQITSLHIRRDHDWLQS